jgi:ferrochelatase
MRTAVVLFNLGGPDSPDAVRPFLFNLFNDPAIIRVPGFIRPLLAALIARRRAPEARHIYAQLGGSSPILSETQAQASALESRMNDGHDGGPAGGYRVFVAMRYWHPRAAEVAAEVVAWAPDRIVLLPLYPQYSTTTSASSLAEWHRAARAVGLDVPTAAVCCYPTVEGFVAAEAGILAEAVRTCTAKAGGTPPRVLFSAHGLPRKIVEGGDPYQWQVERSAAAIAAAADLDPESWRVCYQSRVGPLEWIGPETAAEIRSAGADGIPLVVMPLAFVSEHSETRVELDVEYRRLADESGVPAYVRAETVRTHPEFIEALARMTRDALARPAVCAADGNRICPTAFGGCAMAGLVATR